MNFSKRLISLRQSRNLTQKQLAADVSLSEVGIQNYEGERRKPAFDVLIALADYFDVSLDYLVGRCDNPDSHKPFKIVDDSDEALQVALEAVKKELDKI